MVFMVTFEIPVVTTSLVAITDSLGGFDNVSWIVTSYLLGYVGEYIIYQVRSQSTPKLLEIQYS